MSDLKSERPRDDRNEVLDFAVKSPAELRQHLVESFAQYELAFRHQYPALWWFTLVSPVLLTTVLLVGIGVIWGFELTAKFIIAASATFTFLGRFVIPMGADSETVEGWMRHVNLEPIQLFGMVTMMDFITALFVAFHLGVLFRVPYFGPKIATLVWDGKFLMDRQPWIRRVAFIGLVLFVIFPSSTTGSIGGSVFGRLLGLGRVLTVCGVLLGSLLGNGIMLVCARWINYYIDQDTMWLKLAGVVVIVFALAMFEWRYQQVKKKYLAKEFT